MLASSRVSFGSIRSLGEAFQPHPRSRAGESSPGIAIAPFPFAPVLFSELIERLTAWDRKDKSFIPFVKP